jgi:glycosyltransferase involved in cell wall biosynthesis
MNAVSGLRGWLLRRSAARVPFLSLIVVVFDMEREARRTLQSLAPIYQHGLSEDDYEVIVVDNGSHQRLSDRCFDDLGKNVRYHYIENASPSPAAAVNYGVRQSRGGLVGIMIDGARILSPGVLKYARLAGQAFAEPIIATLGWHLGPDVQMRSILDGYDRAVEDRLLASIDWPNDGYRLFEVSAFAGSSNMGWFLPIVESNCLFLFRDTFEKLGGYDERFDRPGGGLVNIDFYKRACELPGSTLVTIVGEGSFHQIHGGVATNVPEETNQRLWKEWEADYVAIRGTSYERPSRVSEYVGHAPPQALKWIAQSAAMALRALESSGL